MSFVFLCWFIVVALILVLALSTDWISTKFLVSNAGTQSTSTTTSIRRPPSFASSNGQNDLRFNSDWDEYQFDDISDGRTEGPSPPSMESILSSLSTATATADTATVIELDDRIPITSVSTDGGHWENVYNFAPPYQFSSKLCAATYLHENDCFKTENNCTAGLMNWIYVVDDKKNSSGSSSSRGERYPTFDVDGFRNNMRNSRILFLGSSLIRQQVQALVWTLGHSTLKWKITSPAKKKGFDSCATPRYCMVDGPSNISICYQFMGTMATKIYHEGNYTLDHSKRGDGDSSCMLQDTMIDELNTKFDVLFVQNMAWYIGLGNKLDSPTSPSTWVSTVVPTLYHDAMGSFLSRVSRRTKTILVLGQVGTNCTDKLEPETFHQENIPNIYGWNLAPALWDESISLIRDEVSNVQIVDVRDPLMQSVHAHPSRDCLHFCMNSAAVNIYLDKYWTEVFSKYYDGLQTR